MSDIQLKSSNTLSILKPSGTVCIDTVYIADFTIPRSGDTIEKLFLLVDQNYFSSAELLIDHTPYQTFRSEDINCFNNELKFEPDLLDISKYRGSGFLIRIRCIKDCVQHAKLGVVYNFYERKGPLSLKDIISIGYPHEVRSKKVCPTYSYTKTYITHKYKFRIPHNGQIVSMIAYNAQGAQASLFIQGSKISSINIDSPGQSLMFLLRNACFPYNLNLSPNLVPYCYVDVEFESERSLSSVYLVVYYDESHRDEVFTEDKFKELTKEQHTDKIFIGNEPNTIIYSGGMIKLLKYTKE